MTPSVADILRLCTIDPRRGATTHASVVHLLPSLGWGGAERLACTLHRLALANGWQSRIDAPSMPAIDEGLAIETGIAKPTRANESTLQAWAHAARERIRRERPDVVHVHLPYPDRFAAALIAARGRPIVATFHLLPERGRTWSPDEIIRQRSDRVVAILARIPLHARYVTVSRTDRDVLATWLPRSRLVAIRNAPPLPRERTEPLAPLVWPEGVTRVLAVGRLVRQKGYDRLLTALADPHVRELPWALTLVGSGVERDALGSRVHELGLAERVHFASEQPATGLYPQCDLVLSSSRWEGMPLVPLEAVEAGVPVLASDIGPHREIFEGVPETLLATDESRWPAQLEPFLAQPSRRRELATRQRAALPADARREMWNAYRALYEAVAPIRA
jgi:glycosyltransferase involved in cell wall biosynthesis